MRWKRQEQDGVGEECPAPPNAREFDHILDSESRESAVNGASRRLGRGVLPCMEELRGVLEVLLAVYGPEVLVACLKEQVGSSLRIFLDRRVITRSQARVVVQSIVQSSFITTDEIELLSVNNYRFNLMRLRNHAPQLGEGEFEEAVRSCHAALTEPLYGLGARYNPSTVVSALTNYFSISLCIQLHIGLRTRQQTEAILQSLNEAVFEDPERLCFDACVSEAPSDEIADTPMTIRRGETTTIAEFVQASLRRLEAGLP